MKALRNAAVFVLSRHLIFWLALVGLSGSALAFADDPTLQVQAPAYPFNFVAYGDIRFTNPANHELSDPARRDALVGRIAQERPAFLLISGDLVLDGSSRADWAVWDREAAPWRDAGIKIFPALGNHDVRTGAGSDPLDNYFSRFPQLQSRRWYALRAANCLFLTLDSNSDDTPGSPQGEWVRSQLNRVPADVKFVFLGMHHPPYTQSSEHMPGGGHSARPQEQQLAHFLEERQRTLPARIIVIAGHVHNYERYEHAGIMYIVSGGGGATPYLPVRHSSDFYREAGPTYHYCQFTVDRDRLKFQMFKLEMDGGQARWEVKDSFEEAARSK
jgi:acid phosphatase type 7